ncbi:hypothetical protein BJX68DRAFT_270283 [Aspergillus pseudodeflectus]|uniref:Ankyrin repeat-containing domain protein n=1 Tax=Aspergillus pseudodeflectus TaxID=176178 RepID=A0ABR4JTA5_9EURO
MEGVTPRRGATLSSTKLRDLVTGLLFEYSAALGVDPNSADDLEKGATAISIPARGGQLDGVHALIASGAKTDRPNENGETPLACAAAGGHAHIVEILLEKGAEPNFQDAQGANPCVSGGE